MCQYGGIEKKKNAICVFPVIITDYVSFVLSNNKLQSKIK